VVCSDSVGVATAAVVVEATAPAVVKVADSRVGTRSPADWAVAVESEGVTVASAVVETAVAMVEATVAAVATRHIGKDRWGSIASKLN